MRDGLIDPRNTEDHHHKAKANDVTPGMLRTTITRTTPTE